MPFTFSHPALVLPLATLSKRWFSVTGLVIGSLTPDFEYFLRMQLKSHYSHTLFGLLWFDLPLGLLLAFIFHNIVRNPLLDNLPMILQSRFSVFKTWEWNAYFKKNIGVVMLSVLLGAASHLLWDSFTHHNGYFVQTLPALQYSISLFNTSIPILKILQHSSTLLGAVIIAFTIYKLPIHPTSNTSVNGRYWSVLSVLTLQIIILRITFGLDIQQYGNLIVTSISALLLSLIGTPFLLKIISQQK